ncbi:hypothetical protein JCM24511_06086 [Saitozyma sp. JCM 24511]|nr:hypothetical protein JCM24511_06086 [Saitozyma sp. JCM 24511]
MFGKLFIASGALVSLSLALAAPTRRSSQLSCVRFQYGGPFTSFGADGLIHLYSNVTYWDASTQTTSYNATRLGVVDGKIQPCGDCRTTELYGFDVCQGPDGKGLSGLGNSPSEFYGHLIYSNLGVTSCLGAAHSAGNLTGVDLVQQPCEYDYDVVATNGQYWSMKFGSEGTYQAKLIIAPEGQRDVYGPSLDGTELYEPPTGAGQPWTYYGFEAPSF